MFCISNLSSMAKPIVANATLPQNTDSEQNNVPKPPLAATKSSPRANRLRNGPPKPSVMQMERVVGAGSFRDSDPPPLRGSDMRKTVMDLFLGQAMEGPVEKKMRETGEWLATNTEPKFRSSRKGILMFMFQWMLPIWAILLLVAYGAIKLPFSNSSLDDLLM
ncbi:probable NAD(P)H dehydrogenase subunit CRR3, chloroplastic [Abrus precatorius]|uniref:Probable NAD(P)H dehydrogenase subunit CRR3, chloroplastic n=1 Tax=Abrus precatorius TaxID=3816 RepID=A0A8B8M0C7_ABRPR|nr:probable NAD(P)H dehydrogenase subunit CRR3, chloroplastic [Abrus precatorius]